MSEDNGFPRGGRTLIFNLGLELADGRVIRVERVPEGEAFPKQSVMWNLLMANKEMLTIVVVETNWVDASVTECMAVTVPDR